MSLSKMKITIITALCITIMIALYMYVLIPYKSYDNDGPWPWEFKKKEALHMAKSGHIFGRKYCGVGYLNNHECVSSVLAKQKGDLTIKGWIVKDYGNGTYLATYKYSLNGQPYAFSTEVNINAGFERDPTADPALRRKYNIAN